MARSGYLPLQYGQRRPLELGTPLDVSSGQTVAGVDFVMPRAGVIAGRVLDELGDPIEGVTVVAMRSRYWDGQRRLVPTGTAASMTDDAGQYRVLGLAPGTYYIHATTRETWTVSDGGAPYVMGYAPTFFPGTPSAMETGRVSVGVGQQVGNVDVQLIPGRTASITGLAVDSRGKPFSTVMLGEEVRGENFGRFGTAGTAPVGPDGAFVLRNVSPGDYRLSASTPRGAELPEAALASVSVSGVDITGIELRGSQGGSITGRVITEDGRVPTIRGLRVSIGVPVRGQPDPVLLGAFRDVGTSAVAQDGTFSLRGIFGQSRLRVTLPEEWMVQTILHEGRPLSDEPIELRSGETLSDVQVVVTDRVSTVSGRLLDERGVPLVDSTVVVFASDSSKWAEDGRSVRAVRPDQRGQYRVRGLPAGEYLAVALDYVEDGLWNDPAFLESLRSRSQRLTVVDGADHSPLLRVLSLDMLR